jgi:hypothetical protein
MKKVYKTALATAIGIAVSGSLSAATLDQYRMGTPLATDLIGAQNVPQQIVEEDQNIVPSSYYVVLRTPGLVDVVEQGEDSQNLLAATQTIEDAQQSITTELQMLDREAEVLASTRNLAAGIVVRASESALEALQNNPQVEAIYPLFDSKPMLADSVEYIKAKALVASGATTGKGIRVAVLDSGVDYTHKAMGGLGTVAAYDAQNLKVAPAWPQGRVLGGYDFINNDANPLDPRTGGHGTFVASSVLAVAPQADIYAYTVCTGTCPGAAQVSALDAAMDPNGDGNNADRVNVINMSLGGQFGSANAISGAQFLIQRAATLGVNMVISAGNDGPNPFRVGGPSTTPNALSVGAMTHPTGAGVAFTNNTVAGKKIAMAASGFNPVAAFAFDDTSAPLVSVASNLLGCDPFAANSLAGKAVIIDRGTCNFTQKVINAQNAGAKFVIIANNAAGAGPTNAGGSDPLVKIPSVGVSLEDGKVIRDALAKGAVTYSISTTSFSSAGGLATFTSRGPSMQGLLKPEITAPGTNIIMAAVGTGDKTAPNSGTSFSGPITAGAAALLRQALPNRNAQEIKATLMNSANPMVYDLPANHPDAKLAPISAMGAGLVDVEKAVKLPVAAWVEDTTFDTQQAALSFGLMNLSKTTTVKKTVTLKNFGTVARTYFLRIEDRFAADTATGALSWSIPASVTVEAGKTTTFDVSLTINPARLPAWGLENTTPTLEKDAALTKVEFDGFLVFNDLTERGPSELHLPYHVIPKAVAELSVQNKVINNAPKLVLKNNGAVAADVYATQLVATDPKDNVTMDIRAASLDVIDVPTTLCSSGYLLVPTITLENGLNHLLQANTGVDLDVNNDGTYDFKMDSLLHTRLNPNNAPGLMVTFATPFPTTSGFVGNMFHATGQRNVTLSACFEHVGLAASDLNKEVTLRYRTINNGFAIGLGSGVPADDIVVAKARLSVGAADATLTSGGSPVTRVAPGAEVVLDVAVQNNIKGFALLSDVGDALFAGEINTAAKAPVVAVGQSFNVAENSAAGVVVGQVASQFDYDNPVVQYQLVASSSAAFGLEKDGRIVVKTGANLNFEAGTNTASMEVIAVNGKGVPSAPTSVTVRITNVADEKPTLQLGAVKATLTQGEPAGTVIASATAQIKESGATAGAFTVSPALFTYANGNIVLARSVTKQDVGSVTLNVSMTDSAGLASNVVTSNVTIEKKSSGSMGWFSLLLLPLALLRRRQR